MIDQNSANIAAVRVDRGQKVEPDSRQSCSHFHVVSPAVSHLSTDYDHRHRRRCILTGDCHNLVRDNR